MDTIYLTKDRYNELERELKELKTTGRTDIAAQLKHAKELGDLSENAEYEEVRNEQTRLEQKIRQFEEILRNSKIIEAESGKDLIRIGSKVKVKRNGETISYTIVGSDETNPSEGRISNESPIGRGLLGKKVGDVVTTATPKGNTEFHILEIE
jgi:transcription elongation factor GreA